MKKKNKKPDAVVYNEDDQKYDAALKPYGTDLSAPAIESTDTVVWKNRNINKANHHLSAKFEELKKAYEDLLSKHHHNNLIYNSDFNFEPHVGDIYHMYKREDDSTFLSIIAPKECNFNYMASYYLDAEGLWHKTPE